MTLTSLGYCYKIWQIKSKWNVILNSKVTVHNTVIHTQRWAYALCQIQVSFTIPRIQSPTCRCSRPFTMTPQMWAYALYQIQVSFTIPRIQSLTCRCSHPFHYDPSNVNNALCQTQVSFTIPRMQSSPSPSHDPPIMLMNQALPDWWGTGCIQLSYILCESKHHETCRGTGDKIALYQVQRPSNSCECSVITDTNSRTQARSADI